MPSKVASTGVAAALIDDQDAITNGGFRSCSPAPTPIVADVQSPQKTGGKVKESSVAVKTIDNDDGVRGDYYTQYSGNGSIADGWPPKSLWISFTEMYLAPHLHIE